MRPKRPPVIHEVGYWSPSGNISQLRPFQEYHDPADTDIRTTSGSGTDNAAGQTTGGTTDNAASAAAADSQDVKTNSTGPPKFSEEVLRESWRFISFKDEEEQT